MGARGSGDRGGAPAFVGGLVQLNRRATIGDDRPLQRRVRPIWRDDRREDTPAPGDVSVLPTEIPVFPLSRALLLPGGRLPLNIFEPRYLNLVEAALSRGRMFGMVQPRSRDAVGEAPPVANLQRVGCLGRLSSFAETDDGCFLVTLTGLARFDVVSELPGESGYRRVRASFDRFGRDLEPASAFSVDRDRLLDALRRYFRTRDLDANWDAVSDMDDATLVTTLCMVCPFGEREKQALLEAPDLATRARDLQALLMIALHEVDGGDGRRAS